LECLSDHAVAELAQGLLAGADLAAAEAHLAACDDCRVLVSELARATPFPRSKAGSSDAPPEPERIADKYRVEGVLGVGGMGVVVAAMHELLGERVAIKLPRGDLRDDPEARARLLREARAAGRLRGEHIARVLDVGVLDDGSPYIVMEHLTGQTLARRLEVEGPMRADDAAALGVAVCEALGEAHALGIVHRDLKPANLFETTRYDGSRLYKVLDFGIAKAQGFGPTTKSGALVGSPRYMSPEQLKSTRNVDARTDVWALGATLFELVAGRPVFDGPTLSDVCAAIAQGPIPSLKATRPDAPAWLDRVVRKCLERDPKSRYPTAAALAEDLRRAGPRRVAPWFVGVVLALALAAVAVVAARG
jgi:serine/threonine-protein kinase